MQDLGNDNWIILDPLGNVYEIYANQTRGRNNGRSTDMTFQISLFVRPEFCYYRNDWSSFSLQQLGKCLLGIP